MEAHDSVVNKTLYISKVIIAGMPRAKEKTSKHVRLDRLGIGILCLVKTHPSLEHPLPIGEPFHLKTPSRPGSRKASPSVPRHCQKKTCKIIARGISPSLQGVVDVKAMTSKAKPDKSSRLTTETVKGTALALESVDDIEGGDRLALGVLGVGNGVTDDTLEEGLEDTTCLLVDHYNSQHP